jgi:thiol-disulfide isomerase/thioredoxin
MSTPPEAFTPDMSQGAWVLIAALVLATAFGVYRAAIDGRFGGTRRIASGAAGPRDVAGDTDGASEPGVLAGTDIDHELGEKATLLQFSSAFCAPCRATRRTLSDVASVVPGVVHVEVDAEHHLDLVCRLGIVRTPTTLILDADGHEVTRASGAPRKEEVLGTLANAIGS